jgi:feruloyl-CoA synthase
MTVATTGVVMGNRTGSPIFAAPDVLATEQGGQFMLRSADPLRRHPATVIDSFQAWALRDPQHPLVAEREPDGRWGSVTYGAALATAESIGQGLLDRGCGPDRPVLILSGNSRAHLLLTLGAMIAGVPVAPISVAYSLQSAEFTRVRAIAELIQPAAIFADDADRFASALAALAPIPVITTGVASAHATSLDQLADVDVRAISAGGPGPVASDAIAKILFTSGSTGAPKGVLNTHGMLAANQQMIRQVWPFLITERPVIVDWLPWSHTFGGNHNLNLVLTSGGTIYIDEGRPAPDLFAKTVANLTDVSPTIYFNVPAGYSQLVAALEADAQFAHRFFARLRLMFNAAAALPGSVRSRMQRLALEFAGRPIPMTGSWGATETAPAVTSAHFEYTDSRCIGTPLPGAQIKLVPNADAYEIRVKGPMVTPGYFARPDLTDAAFDDDGFYRTGDAVAFAEPGRPAAGLVFRSRLAEDFKLSTGTFVRVGAVRTALLSATSVLADAVIVGEDHDFVCAMGWLNLAEACALLDDDPSIDGELVVHPRVAEVLVSALTEHNALAGSAGRVVRMLVLARPPDLESGEITDKGYVNQREVIKRRSNLVDLLYSDPLPFGVVAARSAD